MRGINYCIILSTLHSQQQTLLHTREKANCRGSVNLVRGSSICSNEQKESNSRATEKMKERNQSGFEAKSLSLAGLLWWYTDTHTGYSSKQIDGQSKSENSSKDRMEAKWKHVSKNSITLHSLSMVYIKRPETFPQQEAWNTNRNKKRKKSVFPAR